MYLRFRSSLMVTAAALLLQVCSPSNPASSQTSSGSPPAQGAQNRCNSESSSVVKRASKQREDELLASVYFQEIESLRSDEIRAQKAVESGKKPLPETRYRGILSAEEERIAYDVLLDAAHQIDEIDRQFMILNDEVHEQYSAELAARRDIVGSQRGEVLDQAVANLKSSLGEEGFHRLTKFLCPAADDSRPIESAPQKDSKN
jgi:dsDNA-binding SOS-regulon protein